MLYVQPILPHHFDGQLRGLIALFLYSVHHGHFLIQLLLVLFLPLVALRFSFFSTDSFSSVSLKVFIGKALPSNVSIVTVELALVFLLTLLSTRLMLPPFVLLLSISLVFHVFSFVVFCLTFNTIYNLAIRLVVTKRIDQKFLLLSFA